MKKTVSFLALLLALAILCSCGNQTGPDTPNGTDTANGGTTTVPEIPSVTQNRAAGLLQNFRPSFRKFRSPILPHRMRRESCGSFPTTPTNPFPTNSIHSRSASVRSSICRTGMTKESSTTSCT